MPRFDWDRLRRIQPLDGADPRVDPDGAVLWERDMGRARDDDGDGKRRPQAEGSGVERLRGGIVVRRVRERREAETNAAAPAPARPSPPLDPSVWIQCPRCRAWVPRKKLLLHARASCAR